MSVLELPVVVLPHDVVMLGYPSCISKEFA